MDDPAKADTVAVPSPAGPRTPSLVPGARVGAYEILSELGRGGMGVVYRARDTRLGREVALKTLSRDPSPEAAERFLREARAAARVRHPGIVGIHEVLVHEGLPVVAFELVEGGSLHERIAASGPCAPEEAARLVAEVARSVEAAHREGVIHRDLKPANVLIDRDGRTRLADFGLARDEGATALTATGDVLGSPAYMAPEQAAGDSGSIGPRTDVYGLGAVLYETLTGRAPFVGTPPLETLRRVASEEPVPPSKARPGVPAALEAVCLRALEKAPRSRYASAELLALDLERFLNGEPVKARPVGPLRRAARWTARQRAALLLVVGGATAFGAARAWDAWQERIRRAEQARQNAISRRSIADRDVADVVSEALLRRYDREDNRLKSGLWTLVTNPDAALDRLVAELGSATATMRAGATLGPGHLRIVRLATRTFAVYGTARERDALARYLELEKDERRAARAAVALAWIGGDDARRAFGAASARFGARGPFATHVTPYAPLFDADKTAIRELRQAIAYEEASQVREARPEADKAVARAPRLAVAWFTRARVRDYGDTARKADLTRALEIEPDFVEALVERAGVDFRGPGDAVDLTDYTRAIELDPTDAHLWAVRASALSFAFKTADAIADFTHAIELDPACAEAWVGRGYARQHSDGEAAARDLEHAIELDASNWPADSLRRTAATFRGH